MAVMFDGDLQSFFNYSAEATKEAIERGFADFFSSLKKNYANEFAELDKRGAFSKQYRETARENIEDIFKSYNVDSLDELVQKYEEKIEYMRELRRQFDEGKDTMSTEELDEINRKLAEGRKELNSVGKAIDTVRSNTEKLNENSGLQGFIKDTQRALKPLNDIAKGLGEIRGAVMSFNDPWAQADAAASKYAKTIGAAAKGMDALRKGTINNVVKSKIGIDFNMSSDELIKAQASYVKGIGRSISISSEDQTNIAAMSNIMGEEGMASLGSAFENFGVSISKTSDHVGRMWKEASEAGISFEKYSENVRQNISIAQNYTFKDGLRGLENMARKAAAIKLDMQSIASLANKAGTVEGAIDVSARLQVLGGSFAQMADPLGMLNESLNDMEGLGDRVAKMIGNMGQLDKSTGEVKVSSFNKQRIRAAADAMGMDYGKLMESVNAQAKRGEIERAIGASSNASKLDDRTKELLMNTGTFKDGKAGVSINGEFKTIDQITNKDYDTLIAETRSEAEDVKDIARNLQSLVEKRSGVKKQKEAVQAKVSEDLRLGQIEKDLTTTIGRSNVLMGTLVFILGLQTAGRIIGGVGDIGKGFKGFKNFFGGKGNVGGTGNAIWEKGLGKVFGKKGAQNMGKAVASEGAGKIVGEASSVAGRAGGNVLGKGVGKAATKGIGGKAAGKMAAKGVTKLGAAAAKGGAAAMIGAVADIGTDMLVDSGKIKKGGAGHTALKMGSKALEWGGAGAMIGSMIPGIGTAVGATVGAIGGSIAGLVSAQKDKMENVLDNQLSAMGIQRRGKYSKGQLEEIDEALNTGKMSTKLRRKLISEGDTDIVNAVKQAKNENQDEKGKVLANLKTANFSIGTANIEIGTGTGISSFQKQRIKAGRLGGGVDLRPISETGRLPYRIRQREQEGASSNVTGGNKGEYNININGTLKLTGENGQSIDIIDTLRKNPQMLRSLANLISKEISNIDKGANVTTRP